MIVNKSELQRMKSSIVGGLETEAGDAGMLSTTIAQFTTVLNGRDFEGEYKKLIVDNLDSYKDAVTQRRNLAIELSSKIGSALDTIINAMEEEDIDTSKKEELKKRLEEAQSSIDSLNSQIAQYNGLYNETQLTAYLDQIRGIRRAISSYQNDLIEIKRDIAKIEKVEAADATALSSLSGLDNQLSSYKKLAADIEALKSNIPAYLPPTTSM